MLIVLIKTVWLEAAVENIPPGCVTGHIQVSFAQSVIFLSGPIKNFTWSFQNQLHPEIKLHSVL